MADSWMCILAITFVGLLGVANGASRGKSGPILPELTATLNDRDQQPTKESGIFTPERNGFRGFPSNNNKNVKISRRLRKSDGLGFVGNSQVMEDPVDSFFDGGLGDKSLVLSANGKNITGTTKRIVKNDDRECRAIYSCLDCYTARLCRPTGDGKFEEVATIECPFSAPNCDLRTGTCMYRADPMCMEPDDFVCLSDGRFPDVSCKFYHVCRNLSAEKHQCEDENENYNAERGSCDYQTDCGFFDCYQLSPGVKTPFTTAPNYFAYCGDNREPIFIDKCPNGTWLNATTQRCEPMCFHRERLIQDPTDCTKYYKCHKLWLNQSSWIMLKELKSCPPGTGFSPEEFSCVSPVHGTDEPDIFPYLRNEKLIARKNNPMSKEITT